MYALYIVITIIIAIIISISFFLVAKVNQLRIEKKKDDGELQQLQFKKLSPFGSVERLSILPLVDFYPERKEFETEPGVSYLIRADKTTILLDLGYNEQKIHPSPLLKNMEKLGVKGKDIDAIFISHLHLDHLGGMNEQRKKIFSISQGPVELRKIPVYAPDNVSPSSWNPGPQTEIIKEPRVLNPGIASIGVHSRYLFIMGQTLEHSLAINVEGKGIVLIIGCGHQTIERIIERAQDLFDEPIYAIIGGLHFPINGGRIMKGPLNIQYIVASDNPPWKGLKEEDVKNSIKVVKRVNPMLVSLSPHDSSDWSIEQFKKAFGNKYVDLKVGKEILLTKDISDEELYQDERKN